jgi:hypothetical protein
VEKKMKIILLVGILFLLFVKNLAAKTITCNVKEIIGFFLYDFEQVTIGPNEAISIATDPADFDPNKITSVSFWRSSIHSVTLGSLRQISECFAEFFG